MTQETPDLDVALAALLTAMRARPKAPQPNAEMLELARGLSSKPLAAFADALATHLWNVDFGKFEATSESLDEVGFEEEIVEALTPLGLADAEGICIGTDGGGAEALLMIADPTQPGGYTMFRYACDGAPYANGEPIEALGQLADMLRTLARDHEVDVQLLTLIGDVPTKASTSSMAWTPAAARPAIVLTDSERARFEGCDEQYFVRAANGALAGHHSDPNGKPPPHLASVLTKVLKTTLILASGEATAAFDVDPGAKFRWVKPSPSGKAFVAYFDTKRRRQGVGNGHAVEYAVDGTERIAITATEPGREDATLWDVAYAGDDDLMVALLGAGDGYLLLLARDRDTGDFLEVDNIAAPKGVRLAYSDSVVVVSRLGQSDLLYFGVLEGRLVRLESPEAPNGALLATFGADGAQARIVGPDAEHVLDTSNALEGVPPKPRKGVPLRRVAGDAPTLLSAEEKKERFGSCYEDTRLRDAVGAVFRTVAGRVGAHLTGRVLNEQRSERLLSGPDGELVLHEQAATRFWVQGHPREERALAVEGEELFEVNLETNEQVLLGPKPAKVGYLVLGGRQRLLTLDKDTLKLGVWAHEAMQPLGEAPLAEFQLKDVQWYQVHAFGHDSIFLPVKSEDGVDYKLLRFIESDTVEVVQRGSLALPGERFDLTRPVVTRVVDGVGYVVVDQCWFRI